MARWFTHFSNTTSSLAGHYRTFAVALVLIIVWAMSGPVFGASQNGRTDHEPPRNGG